MKGMADLCKMSKSQRTVVTGSLFSDSGDIPRVTQVSQLVTEGVRKRVTNRDAAYLKIHK